MPLFTRRAPATLEPSDTWRLQAACRAVDPDVMFPDNDRLMINEARLICRECLVRLECLTEAVRDGESHGIRGGTTPRDRKRIAARVEQGASLSIEMQRAVRLNVWDLGTELDKRTEELPDGHTRWTVSTTSLVLDGHIYTPMQLAFTVGYDRLPQGTVRAACGVIGCLTPDHLTDEVLRAGRSKRSRPKARAAA